MTDSIKPLKLAVVGHTNVGKKTAERLILELRGKLGLHGSGVPGALPMQAGNDHSADITNALLALGYNDKEAAAATKHLPPGTSVEDGIRQALKALVKA